MNSSRDGGGLIGFVFLAIFAAMIGAGYFVGRYAYRRTGNWLLGWLWGLFTTAAIWTFLTSPYWRTY